MRLSFLGAAKTVTGSSFVLDGGKTKLMVDFGMFQGVGDEEMNYRKPDVEFDKITAVLVTHAHLDHCGRLPLLIRYGFRRLVYSTEATRDLMELVLLDASKIAREGGDNALYTEKEVEEVLSMVKTVGYNDDFVVGGFRISYLDAGHILGSASVLVEEVKTGMKVVFSGDLGNTPEPLLMPTHPINGADVAVVESTYGGEVHGRRTEISVLTKVVNQAEADRGIVLIPSFSIERAQELLYIFDGLKKEGKIEEGTLVFIDSPMAIKATDIFRKYPGLYSREVKEQAKKDDPFSFPGLVVCDTVEKSRQIRDMPGAKVIIAGSGMMTGGRVTRHAQIYLSDPKTQLVFVGFLAKGTLGREILDGAEKVKIDGVWVDMKAQITEIKTMSAHADQDQVLDWLKRIKGLREAYLVHGEEIPGLVMKEKIRQELPDVKVVMPEINQNIELLK